MASSTGTDRERSISPRAWASVGGDSASLAAGYARPVPNYDGAMAARPLADLLLVFLKEPRPGAVKSRLAARIGAEAAAAVYRAIAEAAIRRTEPRREEYERLFLFDPPASRPHVQEWLRGQALVAQVGGDLGERM